MELRRQIVKCVVRFRKREEVEEVIRVSRDLRLEDNAPKVCTHINGDAKVRMESASVVQNCEEFKEPQSPRDTLHIILVHASMHSSLTSN